MPTFSQWEWGFMQSYENQRNWMYGSLINIYSLSV
ncbi:MAG: hypothetical protein K0S32_3731 [Bacteroidetes bacterium]|jgi:hypothetical protein|nr:hypothetical protein [Bacteroidota bacterium]